MSRPRGRRPIVSPPRPLVPLVLMAALLAGCGGDGDGGAAASPPPTTTTPQQPAKLPAGWNRRVDVRAGYSLGIPPGWRAQDRGASTLIRSPDHLVAVSIVADRTGDALAVPADQFATQVLAALPYQPSLNPGPAHRFGGTPLDGFSTDASGQAAGGVEQRVTVVVLRHDGYVNYTVVVAANAGRTPAAERAEALAMVRTLRDYPIGTAPGPSTGVEPKG